MTEQTAADSGSALASNADTPASDQHHDHADINTKPVEQVDTDAPKDDPSGQVGGGQVSEAGGASLNEETNAGGADAVPDTHG